MISIAIWSAAIAIFPYALIRRKEKLLYACGALAVMLSFDILIMLNSHQTIGGWVIW